MRFYLVALLFHLALATDADNDSKIVGGQDQPPGLIKYMVIMRNSLTNAFVCGGSIIKPRWILTTASCVLKVQFDVYVEAGTMLLNTPGTRYDIDKPIPHRDYNPSSLENNIGLLKTKTAIVYGPLVQPVDLPYFVPKSSNVLVFGWGLTSKTATNYPNNLQRLTTKLYDNALCQQKFPAVKIFNSNYCTLTVAGQGMCFGDGGGPVVFQNQIAGLVSWGYPCAEGLPDVSVRVDYYVEWIDMVQRIY